MSNQTIIKAPLGGPDYAGSVHRIQQVIDQALCSLWPERPEFKIPTKGDAADLDQGIDLWAIWPERTLAFSIGTQLGLYQTITITGQRAYGQPSSEMRTREAVRQGLEIPIDGVITAYGVGNDGGAYSELLAVRLVRAQDLYSMPSVAWREKLISVRSQEGNRFEFIAVADLHKAGKPVWEWAPGSGWTRTGQRQFGHPVVKEPESTIVDSPTRDQLEAEKWERMRALHEQYEFLRSREAMTGKKLRDDSGQAAALVRVFGKDGSHDNAWWTMWRPPAVRS